MCNNIGKLTGLFNLRVDPAVLDGVRRVTRVLRLFGGCPDNQTRWNVKCSSLRFDFDKEINSGIFM